MDLTSCQGRGLGEWTADCALSYLKEARPFVLLAAGFVCLVAVLVLLQARNSLAIARLVDHTSRHKGQSSPIDNRPSLGGQRAASSRLLTPLPRAGCLHLKKSDPSELVRTLDNARGTMSADIEMKMQELLHKVRQRRPSLERSVPDKTYVPRCKTVGILLRLEQDVAPGSAEAERLQQQISRALSDAMTGRNTHCRVQTVWIDASHEEAKNPSEVSTMDCAVMCAREQLP